MICQLIWFCRKFRLAIINQLNESFTQSRFLIWFCQKFRFWLICYHTNQYCFALLCNLVSEQTQQTFEMTKLSKINSIETASTASIVSVINADIENTKQNATFRYIKKKWKIETNTISKTIIFEKFFTITSKITQKKISISSIKTICEDFAVISKNETFK